MCRGSGWRTVFLYLFSHSLPRLFCKAGGLPPERLFFSPSSLLWGLAVGSDWTCQTLAFLAFHSGWGDHMTLFWLMIGKGSLLRGVWEMFSSLIRKHYGQESFPCLFLFVSVWLCEDVMVGALQPSWDMKWSINDIWGYGEGGGENPEFLGTSVSLEPLPFRWLLLREMLINKTFLLKPLWVMYSALLWPK